MRRAAAAVALLSLAIPRVAAPAADLRLVLVASASSRVPALSAEKVRRLYLGVPFYANGHRLQPLRNETDPLLQEVFMQKVMFMSTESYEREVLLRLYQRGASPPPDYPDLGSLTAALRADPYAVTYLFYGTAAAMPGLKIVAELWRGES